VSILEEIECSANGSSENPPPKVVQGYKFNIFYPDLMYVPLPKYTFAQR
jgi:hypothetical protein